MSHSRNLEGPKLGQGEEEETWFYSLSSMERGSKESTCPSLSKIFLVSNAVLCCLNQHIYTYWNPDMSAQKVSIREIAISFSVICPSHYLLKRTEVIHVILTLIYQNVCIYSGIQSSESSYC